MKEIIIRIKPFTMKQTVYIKDGKKVIEKKVDFRELSKFIADCKGIDTVHLFGNEKMAKKLSNDCYIKYGMKRNVTQFVYNK